MARLNYCRRYFYILYLNIKIILSGQNYLSVGDDNQLINFHWPKEHTCNLLLCNFREHVILSKTTQNLTAINTIIT